MVHTLEAHKTYGSGPALACVPHGPRIDGSELKVELMPVLAVGRSSRLAGKIFTV